MNSHPVALIDIKPGDIVILDTGYQSHTFYEHCKVLENFQTTALLETFVKK